MCLFVIKRYKVSSNPDVKKMAKNMWYRQKPFLTTDKPFHIYKLLYQYKS